MAGRFTVTKICLTTLVLALGTSGLMDIPNRKYASQLKEIRQRIDSSQESDAEKKESKKYFASFNYWKLSKKQKAYLDLPLEEKRRIVHENYTEGNLTYYDRIGVIDKENLSEIECLKLASMNGLNEEDK